MTTTIEEHRKNREFKRTFVPETTDLGKWEDLEALLKQLEERDLSTGEAVEKWLADLSEVQSAISEEYAVRYIEMTCHTDEPELEEKYLYYVTEIMPKLEPIYFELSRKYLAAEGRRQLPRDRYLVIDRATENEVAIFRQENVDLQTEDKKLAQQYQKICGEMTVEFDGREQTLPQMSRYLEETDRDKRRAAWKATVERQMRDRDTIEGIFDEMIALRDKMGRNAGFDGYLEYQFRRLGRFDYGVRECEDFHAAVEKTVMPLRRMLRERRREQLGLKKLAPYDLEVDPLQRPPLRPFENAQQLIEGTDKIFTSVSPVFSKEFSVLRDRQLLDLDSRKGKAPGGYQSTLEEARLPFIFMNAAGKNGDVFTLIHEGGHAFHALACRNQPLYADRNPPIEFCEVASMGMEMMAAEKLEAFYSEDDAKRARQRHLEDVLILLPWIARVDAFQHWIYKNPEHSRREREQQWLELDKRFGDDLDWSEFAEWKNCMWIRQLHFFCVPLYYIEYGIAQLGALQLWSRYLESPEEAIQGYRRGLELGSQRPLPELFAAAGLKFAFNEQTIAPLMEKVQRALAA